MKQFVTREHEIEPVPGLPGALPAGEQILWQGRPSARLVARHSLKSLWIGAYFLILAIWSAASGFYDGHTVGGIVFAVAVLTGLAAALLGMIELFAWAVEKTTLYTITTERVVMRIGVALSLSLNLPYRQIHTVSLAKLGGKAGTIAIGLKPGHRLSWLVQWPHVRGWRFAAPEPSFICLADAEAVSDVLAMAYARYSQVQAQSSRLRVVVSNDVTVATPHVAAAE